jgi:hypothetical protein
MSTWTDEISTAVKTAAARADEATTHAERSLESARSKTETAYAHGWDGVGATMEQAAEHLEWVTEQLTSTERACQSAGEVLDQITEQLSSPEVAERLASAIEHLDTAVGTAEAAIGLIDEAIGACETAGQQSLPASLQALREEADEIREQAQQIRADAQTEHETTGTWSEDQQDEGGSRGNCVGLAAARRPAPSPDELAPATSRSHEPPPQRPLRLCPPYANRAVSWMTWSPRLIRRTGCRTAGGRCPRVSLGTRPVGWCSMRAGERSTGSRSSPETTRRRCAT